MPEPSVQDIRRELEWPEMDPPINDEERELAAQIYGAINFGFWGSTDERDLVKVILVAIRMRGNPMNDQRHYPKKPRNPARDERIRSMFNAKVATLDDLMKINGLTKARIHQIIHGRTENSRRGPTNGKGDVS